MDEKKQMLLYANLMDEVKFRIDAINTALQGHTRLPTPLVREFCYLQIRMLCELIALSCLVAHGDITFLKPHKLGRKTSANEIVDRLTKLRPHFFPMASIQQQIESKGRTKHFHLTEIDPPPLSKESFLKLYGKTHQHLHRGSLKNLLSVDVNSPLDSEVNAPEIVKWAQKINDLLSMHVIAISGDKRIVCVLRASNIGGKVSVATALRSDLIDSGA
jgi:hypothetical protein